MADHQDPFAGKCLLPSIKTVNSALVEIRHSFTAGGEEVDGVLPEVVKMIPIALLDLPSGQPFPLTEANLPQIFIDMQWNSVFLGQLLGKTLASLHG